jgi:alkylresorcinol/alkylpyrone synthase
MPIISCRKEYEVGKIENGFRKTIEVIGTAPQEQGAKSVRIASVASAVPEHRYPQNVITTAFKSYWNAKLEEPEKLDWLHSRVGVDFRHLAFPLERYPQFSTWGEANAAWLEAAEELGVRAIDTALDRAGMSRQDLNALIVVSITGIASPSLDARLINRMALRPDIKRTPIFGIGCAGGAIGLTRAADYALAYPDHTAAILCVEICSLTMQPEDFSTANLIASGLFGDGAAAVIVRGSRTVHRSPKSSPQSSRPGPQILGTGSVFYSDTEEIMGWNISEAGFKIVLSPQLPDLIKGRLAGDVDGFLGNYQLRRADIGNWVIHTGGPKVLDSIQSTLELKDSDLDRSWDCLRQFGNLSSASVLLVLEEVLMNDTPPQGTHGVLMAMGPGFCLEMILLKW